MFQKTLISDSVPIFMPSGPFVIKPSRCALSKIPPTKLQWDFPIPERLLPNGPDRPVGACRSVLPHPLECFRA